MPLAGLLIVCFSILYVLFAGSGVISSVVVLSPTVTVFVITFWSSISACVTSYVPVNDVSAFGANPFTTSCRLIISSSTFTSFNVTFPVFFTFIVYVTVSPAFTSFLSATFVTS